jgi:hypothetical protein
VSPLRFRPQVQTSLLQKKQKTKKKTPKINKKTKNNQTRTMKNKKRVKHNLLAKVPLEQ